MSQNKNPQRFEITPPFRLSYPSVFKPTQDLNGRMKFEITMYFPKTAEVAKAMGLSIIPWGDISSWKTYAIEIAKKSFGPDVDLGTLKFFKFRDGDKPTPTGKIMEEAKGCWVLKASTGAETKDGGQVTIDVRGIEMDKATGKARRITDPSELYAGCWCRAHLTIQSWTHKVGGRGVTLYLNGLQKIQDAAAFSGRPRSGDEFDAVASASAGMTSGADDPFND